MKQTLDFNDFRDAFRAYDRLDNFSRQGLELLFDHCEECDPDMELDASAADENFHDWCANYGYSDDSIKAMNTYKACLETAQALRKHFPPDTLRSVRELLQDY